MTPNEDTLFLQQLAAYPTQKVQTKIDLLDFATERVLESYNCNVIDGSITISAQSRTRRTGSLTILADQQNMQITSLENKIAINKKIKISVGVENKLIQQYPSYGETIWFPLGIFVITSLSLSPQNNTISLSFTDKMARLNGVAGGVLPANTVFSEEADSDGILIKEITAIPTIRQIIKESVQHFGEENASRIIIDDVPEVGRHIVTYFNEETPLYMINDSGLGKNYVLYTAPRVPYQKYVLGDVVGYLSTPLTYPGELSFGAGSNMTQVLDKIVETLGNYEYFYDVDGVFHFQQQKNFITTGNTRLNIQEDKNFTQGYLPTYSSIQRTKEFSNDDLVIDVSYSPSLDNIKNDFIVWGTKDVNGNEHKVRYHLAIDDKPKESESALFHKDIYKITNAAGDVLRYSTTPTVNDGEYWELFAPGINGAEMFNWREELYRGALLAYGSSTRYSAYDEELLAEWRLLYDFHNLEYQAEWNDYWRQRVSEIPPWTGYKVDTISNPKNIRYWLDIIDTPELEGYKVSKIGRRSKIEEDTSIDSVYPNAVPDLVFIENPGDLPTLNQEIEYYQSIGQSFCLITNELNDSLIKSNYSGSCYERIRQLLYTHTLYAASISLTCLPLFYLDVKDNVTVYLSKFGINGVFCIESINFNFKDLTKMTIQLSEIVEIV